MALRAGYYGLKNSVKKALEKLAADTSGMKIIKSFGDGLNLTNAGKLNLTAATASKIGGVKVGEGLEIVDGALNVTVSGGFDYSTDEVDTGQKWIDGKSIYCKVLENVTTNVNSYTTDKDTGVAKIETLIYAFLNSKSSGGYVFNDYCGFCRLDNTGETSKIAWNIIASGAAGSGLKCIIFYTKTAATE